MDKKHKQITTTYPVALKYGQGRVHVAHPIPWHTQCELVKCPDCEVHFILTGGFSRMQFLELVQAQHKRGEKHPDHIPSAPEWTSISDCDCGLYSEGYQKP